MPVIIIQGQAFQNPNHCGPDSNDWFSFGFHLQKIVQHCFGNLEVFGMHPMFPQVRILDSTEGSKADMQGQFENPDPSMLDGVQHFRSEVQSCSRSSDRPGDTGITGLVTFPVPEDLPFLRFFAFDIGR